MLDIFSQKPAKEISNYNSRVMAIEYLDNSLYAGDYDGSLHSFQLDMSLQGHELIDHNSIENEQRISNKKIDVIKGLPQLNTLLVLSDGCLHHIDGRNLSKASEPLSKNCALFCVQDHSSQKLQVLIITKKKKGEIFELVQGREFKLKADTFDVPDIPLSINWVQQRILMCFKKEWSIITSDNNFKFISLPIPVGSCPLSICTDKNEFLIITTGNIGIYADLNGQLCQKNNIPLDSKTILGMQTIGSYLIVLFENIIQIFSTMDSQLLQQINLLEKARNLSCSKDKLFFSCLEQIFYLQPIPFELLIQKCLLQQRVDEAQSIFKQNVLPSQPDYQEKKQQLDVDSIWPYLKNLKFDKAKELILKSNFDIRELLVFYPEFVSSSVKFQQLNSNKVVTISLLINESLQQKQQSKDKIHLQVQEYVKEATEMLLEVLEKKSQFFSDEYVNKEDLVDFRASNQKQFKFQPVTQTQLIDQFDYAIIKLLIAMEQFDRLKQFFVQKDSLSKNNQRELESSIMKLQQRHPLVVAQYFQSVNRINEALELWRQIGETCSESLQKEASQQTLDVLRDCKDVKLIEKYIVWILIKNPVDAEKLFFFISEETVHPDQMLKLIENIPQMSIQNEMKEKYLEIITINKQIDGESFHNQLGLLYLKVIFDCQPKQMSESIKESDPNKQKLDTYRKKFKTFIKSPCKKYRAGVFLDQIKDSWMFEEEIILYGQENQHNLAIKKLVQKQMFKEAEMYCAEKEDQLLTVLFQNYSDILKQVMESLQTNKNDKKLNQYYYMYKNAMNQFLKTYADHSQIDPIKIMEAIPEDWIVSDQNESSGVYQFLSQLTDYTLNKKRNLKCSKHLSEIDMLNVECELALSKKANIRITNEKNCSVCRRRIGDKVFFVYPNGVVVHHTCISNKGLNFCPQTDQNFEQTFKI